MCEFFIYLVKLFFSTLTIGLVLGIVSLIFKESIKNLIQYSVKLNFDKKLEDYKSQELKRQKAVLVAELLSEWISKPEDTKKLNQLTLEAFIWIPKDTALKLSQLLSHSPDSPKITTIVSEMRSLILGSDEKIDENIIILFPPNNNE